MNNYATDIQRLNEEVRKLKSEIARIAIGGQLIPGVSVGTSNTPTPQSGAIIYGTAVPLWARLPIDTDGKIIRAVGGFPAWSDENSGGAGAPATKMLAPDAFPKGTIVTIATDQYFNVSADQNEIGVIGVLMEDCVLDQEVFVQHLGYCEELLVFDPINPGDHLGNGDEGTVGQFGVAMPTGRSGSQPFMYGTMAIALGTNVSGLGTIPAYIFPTVRPSLQLGFPFVPTTDDTPALVGATEVPEDLAFHIEYIVVARRTGGIAGSEGDSGSWHLAGTFKNIGGVASQVGTTTVIHSATDIGSVALSLANNPIVEVEVTGEIDMDIGWTAVPFYWTVGT